MENIKSALLDHFRVRDNVYHHFAYRRGRLQLEPLQVQLVTVNKPIGKDEDKNLLLADIQNCNTYSLGRYQK